ncbi:hypothetical protein, partial [Salipiger abyssi]|uniref:hypothetical protein n=1 Tax=Salipiger abyssi TaxID=1250539 RepID=UPI004059BC64
MAGIDRERCQARFRQSADRALDVFAFSPERCAEALAAGEPLVILHRNARHFLQSALRDGRSASDGLAEWQEACSQILATWRQARRNVLLIEEAALLRSEARALTRLTALLGAEALTEPAEMPEAASDIFALLADQALAAAPEAAALDMDLEASSLPAPQRVPSLAEVDAAVRAWQALDETTATLQAGKADAEGRADAIAAERDLLLGHVAELHDEVLGQTGTADTLRRQLLEANGSVETWKKTLANAETRFAEALAQQERTQAQLSAERDLLLGHIAELHAEVLGQSGTADTLRRQLLEANGSVETWKKTLANAETRFAETRVQQERT